MEFRSPAPEQSFAVLERCPVPVWVVIDDSVVFVNQSARRLLGLPEGELEDASVYDFIPPADQGEFRARSASAMREETLAMGERRLVRADGSTIDVEVATWSTPFGIAIAVCESFLDISLRRQTERDLRQRAQILEQAHEAIVIVDLSGHITSWNPAAERLLGYSSEETLGRHFRMLYFEGEAPDIAERLKAMDQGTAPEEVRHRHKNGTERWVGRYASLLRDTAGNPYGIIGYAHDVTLRRQMLADLAQREALYRSFTESMPAIVFSAGVDGRCDYVNSFWQGYAGLNTQQSLGLKWAGAVHPEDRARTLEAWRAATMDGQPFENEFRIRRHDGAWRWNIARAVPVRGSNGAVTRWVGGAIDIHDRHEAEAQVRGVNALLERANHDMEMFSYAVGHDLVEPARTISSFSTLLVRSLGDVTPQAREALTHIEAATERLRALGNSLTAFARAGSGESSVAPVNMTGVFHGVRFSLQTLIDQAQAEATCAPDLPTVHASESQLTQLLQNLISNALKYRSSRPPKIHFSAARQDDLWLFSVTDNGLGIEPEYTERIFSAFRRLHGREIPGTGLGLAIARRIVERHGGRIWVESTPGAGSKFYFTLPA